MIESLIGDLKHHRRGRTRCRKALFKLLRGNSHMFKADGWIQRKMRLNYLGDLTDPQLLEYAETIKEKLHET